MSTPKPKYNIWQAIETALALSLRAIDEIRALARQPGPPGEQGVPGFSADEMAASLEGDRTLVLSYVRGTERKEFGRIELDFPIYRGVFKDGSSYAKADMVTRNGAVWHCNEATTETPGTSAHWQLAVKQGRDGKDAKMIPAKSREPIKI